MVYPEHFEEKVGFITIRALLKAECRNNGSLAYVEKISFSNRYNHLKKLLLQTEEYRQLLVGTKPFPDAVVPDLSLLLTKITIPGSYLEPEETLLLHDALTDAERYIRFFQHNKAWPALAAIVETAFIDPIIIKETGRIFNEKGAIDDHASPQLAVIRKEITGKTVAAEKTINKILKEAVKKSILPSEAEITIRNGRSVIPVPVSKKREIRGVVHDESSTGQTVFIEPTAVFEMNNEVRELYLAERREIIKILIGIADIIRPVLDEIADVFQYTAMLDFIRAKAKLALKINGFLPEIIDKPGIEWHQARHPLLLLSLQEQKREIIPLDITLTPDHRILVISGPNAGGKSVCLKTVGLIQYMLQCGLLVPLGETSTAGLFSHLFIDIGDEQSIENDLSTYSSHLIHMRYFSDHAHSETLFLIDEFGSGTEPSAGGAIAEAVLEELAKKGAFGVITTHYANLKIMAGKIDGIVNGAMLFDVKKLQPLYKLSVGKPGSSFAFEIAKNTGFAKNVLEKAKAIAGHTQLDFDQQLQQLEADKAALEKRKMEVAVADSFLAEMIEKYERQYRELTEKRKEILIAAKREAAAMVKNTNRLIEQTIKEIKEAGAEKEKTKEIRQKLPEKAESITRIKNKGLGLKEKPISIKKQDKKPSEDKKEKDLPEETLLIRQGSWVSMTGSNMPGEVLALKSDTALVAFEHITMHIKTSRLQPVKKPVNPRPKKSYGALINQMNDKMAAFSSEIDIRGKRAEEAQSIIKQFIDDAVLLQVKNLSILHGKGDGVLRQVVRNMLSEIDVVESFADAHVDAGGHGITRVMLK